MRILVCGGPDYTDPDRVLDAMLDAEMSHGGRITMLIHGAGAGAEGFASSIVRHWNKTRPQDERIEVKVYQTDHRLNGGAAVPIRNSWALHDGKPAVVLSFGGADDMVARARKAGVPVVEVKL